MNKNLPIARQLLKEFKKYDCSYILVHHISGGQETEKRSFGLLVELFYLPNGPPHWRLHTAPFNAERQAGKL